MKKQIISAALAVIMSMSSLTAISSFAATDDSVASYSTSVLDDMQIVGKKVFKLSKSNTRVEVRGVYSYDGRPVTPALKVTYAPTTAKSYWVTLKEGTDYSISCSGNNKAGKASYTVRGRGKYSGSISGSYTIPKGVVTSISVDTTAPEYRGYGVSPRVNSVKFLVRGHWVLVGEGDYKVKTKTATNAGEYASVTITPKGNYKNSASITSKCKVTKAPVYRGVYSETAARMTSWKSKSIKIDLRYESTRRVMTEGEDYTVTSVKVLSHKGNTGKAEVIIKGKGNYTGGAKITMLVNKIKK